MMYTILLWICLAVVVPHFQGSSAFPASPVKETPAGVFALDIESCACQPTSTSCDVTISRTIFSEIQCAPNENFCCSVATKTADENKNETLEGKANNRGPAKPLVKEIPASSLLARDGLDLVEGGGSSKTVSTKCRCKSREKCPEKHTDYSFGFHCSYNKVRCCQPVEDGMEEEEEEELTETNSTGGRLINVVSNPKNENSCRCLPEKQCATSPINQMQERKDTVCPQNLIQCCGEAILVLEKKSDDETIDVSEAVDRSPSYVQPEIADNNTRLGLTVTHQPVPIPLMKIPPSRDAPVEVITSTLPPPRLPAQYFYSPATPYYFNRYFSPHTQKVSNDLYNRVQPATYSTGNRYVINHNGRGLAENQRSSGSFLSNLASLLG